MSNPSEEDNKLREEVIDALHKDKLIDISKIKANVVDGIVILEGSINSLWQRIRIEKVMNSIKDAREIINKLLILPKKSAIIRDLMSEDLSDERLIRLVEAHLSKLEVYFGLVGMLITTVLITVTAIITPEYNPIYNTVSSLGTGVAKTIFSVAFVIAGSTAIPFLIYLEKMLVGLNEFVRRLATGIAIFTSLCIALVGILPDRQFFYEDFLIFHGFIAIFAFVGSGIYITLYSYLMLKSKAYKLYHLTIGFLTAPNLIILLIFFVPLAEWILTVNIFLWVMITAINLLKQ